MTELSVPDQNRLKVARDTMRMHCIGAMNMGGMNHVGAVKAIHELTGKTVKLPNDCTCK